jgi:hypothetical protein
LRNSQSLHVEGLGYRTKQALARAINLLGLVALLMGALPWTILSITSSTGMLYYIVNQLEMSRPAHHALTRRHVLTPHHDLRKPMQELKQPINQKYTRPSLAQLDSHVNAYAPSHLGKRRMPTRRIIWASVCHSL